MKNEHRPKTDLVNLVICSLFLGVILVSFLGTVSNYDGELVKQGIIDVVTTGRNL